MLNVCLCASNQCIAVCLDTAFCCIQGTDSTQTIVDKVADIDPVDSEDASNGRLLFCLGHLLGQDVNVRLDLKDRVIVINPALLIDGRNNVLIGHL